MPRVAWDGPYGSWRSVRRAIRTLKQVGYGRKDIFVFMVYNHKLSYVEMRRKLDACRRWRVRVIDCRYRPLDCTEDNYRPGPKPQDGASITSILAGLTVRYVGSGVRSGTKTSPFSWICPTADTFVVANNGGHAHTRNSLAPRGAARVRSR